MCIPAHVRVWDINKVDTCDFKVQISLVGISDVETKEIRNGTFSGIGRITGSASIETLVRVGIEKENGLSPDSKMVVLHDFTPCVDDELQVKRGQVGL